MHEVFFFVSLGTGCNKSFTSYFSSRRPGATGGETPILLCAASTIQIDCVGIFITVFLFPREYFHVLIKKKLDRGFELFSISGDTAVDRGIGLITEELREESCSSQDQNVASRRRNSGETSVKHSWCH